MRNQRVNNGRFQHEYAKLAPKKIHLLEMQTFNAILNDILIDQLIAKHLLFSLGIDGYKVNSLLGY